MQGPDTNDNTKQAMSTDSNTATESLPHEEKERPTENLSTAATTAPTSESSTGGSSPSVISLPLAFALSPHSPFTRIGDDRIYFDITADDIDSSTQPLCFATFQIANPSLFTLSQLRSLIEESLEATTLTAMSTQGILTPHQAVALANSDYAFLSPSGIVDEAEEEKQTVDLFFPILLLTVRENLIKAPNAARSRSGSFTQGTSPLLATTSPNIGDSAQPFLSPTTRRSSLIRTPPTAPLTPTMTMPLRQSSLLFSDQLAGDGIQPQEFDHDRSHAAESGISYSRAATISEPTTRRRGSFDMGRMDSMVMLESAPNRPQRTNILDTMMESSYHTHGLRVPSHPSSHAVDTTNLFNAFQPPASQRVSQTTPPVTTAALTAIPQLPTIASASTISSRLSDEEEEISPVEYPQASNIQRRASLPIDVAAARGSRPATPTRRTPATSPENPPSSSLPASINSLIDFIHRQTSSGEGSKSNSPTEAGNEKILGREEEEKKEAVMTETAARSGRRPSRAGSRDNLAAASHTNYNSMGINEPTLRHRAYGSMQSTPQTTPLKKKKSPILHVSPQEESPSLPSRSSPSLVSPPATFTLDSAARKRLESQLHQRGSSSAGIHFSDMLNEYSRSSMNVLKEVQQQYRIIVIGERDAKKAIEEEEERRQLSQQEQQEKKEPSLSSSAGEKGEGKPESRPKKKQIVSDLDRLTTRVQPIRPGGSKTQQAAARRVAEFHDVLSFLASRSDEKREAQKTRAPAVPAKGKSIDSSPDKKSPSGLRNEDLEPLWIAVESAPASVISKIGEHFGLHPLTIEDCQSVGIREKLEVFTDYLFIVFHALDKRDDGTGTTTRTAQSEPVDTFMKAAKRRFSFSNKATLPSSSSSSSSLSLLSSSSLPSSSSATTTSLADMDLSHSDLDLANSTPVKVIIFPTCVLTFHDSNLVAVNKVRKQLAKLYANRLDNTAWLVHALLDTITDSLIPVVGLSCRQADSLEDNIYIPTAEDAITKKLLLRQMNIMGRRLAFLRQRMWSKRDILMSLIEKDWAIFLRGVKIPYLRDVYDHVETMLHRIDTSIEVVDTIQSTYLSIVNIDVSVAAENTNKAMKKMSAAATIILPLTLVSAIMGMNTYVPWQAADNLSDPQEYPPNADMLEPFIIMMILFAIFAIFMYIYFKHIRYV